MNLIHDNNYFPSFNQYFLLRVCVIKRLFKQDKSVTTTTVWAVNQ